MKIPKCTKLTITISNYCAFKLSWKWAVPGRSFQLFTLFTSTHTNIFLGLLWSEEISSASVYDTVRPCDNLLQGTCIYASSMLISVVRYKYHSLVCIQTDCTCLTEDLYLRRITTKARTAVTRQLASWAPVYHCSWHGMRVRLTTEWVSSVIPLQKHLLFWAYILNLSYWVFLKQGEHDISFKTFAATWFNIVFSGHQPRQML
jgi:hypothetical protein